METSSCEAFGVWTEQGQLVASQGHTVPSAKDFKLVIM